MQSAIILTRESRSSIYNAPLLEVARLDHHFRADRASIAPRADELERDPVIRTIGIIAIHHGRLVLVRNDHVLRATIRKVGDLNRSTIIQVSRADILRNVNPPRDSAIQIYA